MKSRTGNKSAIFLPREVRCHLTSHLALAPSLGRRSGFPEAALWSPRAALQWHVSVVPEGSAHVALNDLPVCPPGLRSRHSGRGSELSHGGREDRTWKSGAEDCSSGRGVSSPAFRPPPALRRAAKGHSDYPFLRPLIAFVTPQLSPWPLSQHPCGPTCSRPCARGFRCKDVCGHLCRRGCSVWAGARQFDSWLQ